MATTPVIPSVIAGAMNVTGKDTKTTRTQKPDTGQRILLKRGAVSPSVATLQRKLNVPDDGYFGPVTEKAVKKFQKKHHLPATGMVDVKTWLKLFPDGMVIYAPHTGVAQMSAQAPQSVLRQSSAQSGAGVAAVDAASVTKAKKSHAKKGSASLKKAGTASSDVLPSGGQSVGSGSSVGLPSGSGSGVPSSGGGGGAPGGGSTIVPSGPFTSASEMIAAMIAAANRIDAHHYAYSWGGGHNASFSGPYDCSGAVSAVLHAAGLLNRPMVSGEFMHWGRPGSGAVTIYANAGHVYMSILGHFFGTTHANPGGGAGWFAGAPRPGFVVVHVPFEAMQFSKAQLKRAVHKAEASNRHDSTSYKSVTPGFQGEAPGQTGTASAGTTNGGVQSTPQQGGYTASAASQQTQAASAPTTYPASGTQATGGAAAAPAQAPAASSGSSSGLSGGSSSAGASAAAPSSGASYSGGSSSAGTSSARSAGSGSSSSGASGSGSAGLKDEATSTASSAASSAKSAAAPAASAPSGATPGSSGSSGSGSSGNSGK